MSRPALSLYRQVPITYKHRSLLLDASSSQPDDVRTILPKIVSGFTGLLVTLEQLEGIPEIKQSSLPKIARLNAKQFNDANNTIAVINSVKANAILVQIELGKANADDQLLQLQKLVKLARAQKLVTILQINFNNSSPGKLDAILIAYALRLTMDYKMNYAVFNLPKDLKDLHQIQNIAGGGNFLVNCSLLPSQEVKRILAIGADGIVVPFSELAAATDPGQTAFHLGEAVFGPGSYHVKS